METVLGQPVTLFAILGHVEAILGASWEVLGRRESEKARTDPKQLQKPSEKTIDFASLDPLEKSLGCLGLYWGDLRGLLGSLGASGSRKGEDPTQLQNHRKII